MYMSSVFPFSSAKLNFFFNLLGSLFLISSILDSILESFILSISLTSALITSSFITRSTLSAPYLPIKYSFHYSLLLDISLAKLVFILLSTTSLPSTFPISSTVSLTTSYATSDAIFFFH